MTPDVYHYSAGQSRSWRYHDSAHLRTIAQGDAKMNALILFAGFVAIGLWLEGINGKRDLFDLFLTPAPLGFLAAVIVAMERWAA